MNYDFTVARLGDSDYAATGSWRNDIKESSWSKGNERAPAHWSSDRAPASAAERWREKETVAGDWSNTNTLSDINIYNVAFLEHTTLPPIRTGL